MTSAMTKEKALQFLRDHQPMPDELDLDEKTIRTFDEVRMHFLEYPTKECVPLFLGAFANDSGFGVYQLVGGVFWKFEPADVVTHLIAGIRSKQPGARYWSTEIAADFPTTELIEPLSEALAQGDHDLKFAAVTALERIKDPAAEHVIRAALESEEDTEIRQLIAEVIGGF